MAKKRDTEKFLEIMERQNEAVARQQAAKGAPPPEAAPDPIRAERERERREKYGPLRARATFGGGSAVENES